MTVESISQVSNNVLGIQDIKAQRKAAKSAKSKAKYAAKKNAREIAAAGEAAHLVVMHAAHAELCKRPAHTRARRANSRAQRDVSNLSDDVQAAFEDGQYWECECDYEGSAGCGCREYDLGEYSENATRGGALLRDISDRLDRTVCDVIIDNTNAGCLSKIVRSDDKLGFWLGTLFVDCNVDATAVQGDKNGWTVDGKTLVFIETARFAVYSFELDQILDDLSEFLTSDEVDAIVADAGRAVAEAVEQAARTIEARQETLAIAA